MKEAEDLTGVGIVHRLHCVFTHTGLFVSLSKVFRHCPE